MEKEKEFLISIIYDILDKNTSDTVRLLIDKKNVNEFLIAKKLKLTINQTRNMLYRLSDLGLVSFTRKKDKKKGWYTYFWTLNLDKSFQMLENILRKKMDELNFQLKSKETKRFYSCKVCKTEVSEETALLNNFTCRECGEVYELSNNVKTIKEIKSRLAKIQKDYEIVKTEIDKITDKEAKRVRKEMSKKRKRKVRKVPGKPKKPIKKEKLKKPIKKVPRKPAKKAKKKI